MFRVFVALFTLFSWSGFASSPPKVVSDSGAKDRPREKPLLQNAREAMKRLEPLSHNFWIGENAGGGHESFSLKNGRLYHAWNWEPKEAADANGFTKPVPFDLQSVQLHPESFLDGGLNSALRLQIFVLDTDEKIITYVQEKSKSGLWGKWVKAELPSKKGLRQIQVARNPDGILELFGCMPPSASPNSQIYHSEQKYPGAQVWSEWKPIPIAHDFDGSAFWAYDGISLLVNTSWGIQEITKKYVSTWHTTKKR